MGVSVKLQAFEGPLDLLLHLIDKNKVNIYDIPIAEITGQYLEYIRGMEEQDLGYHERILVMAATPAGYQVQNAASPRKWMRTGRK